MATVCYSWDDAKYRWDKAPFTWAEGCVVLAVGGLSPYRKERLRKDLTEYEKDVLVNLFFKMDIDELVIENKTTKTKNKKIKIKLKDVETLVSEQRLIEIKSVNVREEIIKEEKVTVKVIIK